MLVLKTYIGTTNVKFTRLTFGQLIAFVIEKFTLAIGIKLPYTARTLNQSVYVRAGS